MAGAELLLPPGVLAQLRDGDIRSPKGPVFQTAIIAGTMAAKQTSGLIPFCHPLPLDAVRITIEPPESGILRIEAMVKTSHKTGVEMEALVAASVAAKASLANTAPGGVTGSMHAARVTLAP